MGAKTLHLLLFSSVVGFFQGACGAPVPAGQAHTLGKRADWDLDQFQDLLSKVDKALPGPVTIYTTGGINHIGTVQGLTTRGATGDLDYMIDPDASPDTYGNWLDTIEAVQEQAGASEKINDAVDGLLKNQDVKNAMKQAAERQPVVLFGNAGFTKLTIKMAPLSFQLVRKITQIANPSNVKMSRDIGDSVALTAALAGTAGGAINAASVEQALSQTWQADGDMEESTGHDYTAQDTYNVLAQSSEAFAAAGGKPADIFPQTGGQACPRDGSCTPPVDIVQDPWGEATTESLAKAPTLNFEAAENTKKPQAPAAPGGSPPPAAPPAPGPAPAGPPPPTGPTGPEGPEGPTPEGPEAPDGPEAPPAPEGPEAPEGPSAPGEPGTGPRPGGAPPPSAGRPPKRSVPVAIAA